MAAKERDAAKDKAKKNSGESAVVLGWPILGF